MNSESGLISVSAVIGIAFAGLVVYLLLGALNGDSSYYGEVPIPSQNVAIDLPSGETDIYLSEKGDPDKLAPLTKPDDLNITFTSESGDDTVRLDDRDGDVKETDDGENRIVAAVSAPSEGTYLVSVSSPTAQQLASPMLTFGLSPLGAVEVRFKDVIDELNGPTGIVVLAGLVLLFLAPRITRALER